VGRAGESDGPRRIVGRLIDVGVFDVVELSAVSGAGSEI
jgi:hypothetical protein